MHQLTRSRSRQCAGFTLIEIAIVLVVIGLIVGGILKGRELIGSARVRAMSDQITAISMAWLSFQERYRALPGDYSRASTQLDATLVDGNGNGIIDNDTEAGQVWAHLSRAGLLAGRFDGAATAADFDCGGETCPQNPFNRGYQLRYSDQSVGSGGSGIGHSANELWLGSRIPVKLLAEVDRKLDDGRPASGQLQLSRDADGFSGSATCIVGNDYALLQDAKDCAAIWRNF